MTETGSIGYLSSKYFVMKVSWLVIGFSFFLLAGCATSRIVRSWKSPSLPQKKYTKILVVGLMRDTDQELREKMEDHLVDDLRDKGYNAVSSFKEYGPKRFEGLKEDMVLKEMRESGVDGIITIAMLDKKSELYRNIHRTPESPDIVFQRRFWGYYSLIFDRIYEPGYTAEFTKYFWESNFYEMEYRELLYSARTESFDPRSAESLAHEYGKIIVSDMVKKGILK
jgi:hypothetical protein